MRKLFLVRHGDYSTAGDKYLLNETGKQQMSRLGQNIKRVVDSSPTYIISSPATRAYQSAEVLAQILNSPEIEQIPYLWSGGGSGPEGFQEYFPNALDKMLDVVDQRRNRAENLIMITHLEVTRYFPPFFASRERLQYQGYWGELEKGQSYIFDLKNNQVQKL